MASVTGEVEVIGVPGNECIRVTDFEASENLECFRVHILKVNN